MIMKTIAMMPRITPALAIPAPPWPVWAISLWAERPRISATMPAGPQHRMPRRPSTSAQIALELVPCGTAPYGD